MPYTVYAYIEKKEWIWRYVGMTKRPKNRRLHHESINNTGRGDWGWFRDNNVFEYKICKDNLTRNDAAQLEKYLINLYGETLLNIIDNKYNNVIRKFSKIRYITDDTWKFMAELEGIKKLIG